MPNLYTRLMKIFSSGELNKDCKQIVRDASKKFNFDAIVDKLPYALTLMLWCT